MSALTDFIKGQRDCRDGVDHKAGQSKEYDNGYAFQYEMEQKLSPKEFN